MGLLGQFLQQREERKFRGELREIEEAKQDRIEGLLGEQGEGAIVPQATDPLGQASFVPATEENIQRLGGPGLLDAPTEFTGGAITPIQFDPQAGATGVFSQDPNERAQAIAQIAAIDPQRANAINQSFATAAQSQKTGGRGRAAGGLSNFNTQFNTATGETIESATDQFGQAINLETGQPLDFSQPFTPFSQAAVTRFQEGKKATEEEKNLNEFITTASPNEVYRKGFRVNDAGEVQLDPATGRPIKLKTIKEGVPRSEVPRIRVAGEVWDDTKEINALLNDADVQSALSLSAAATSLPTKVIEAGSNAITKWLQGKGVDRTKSLKAAEAIVRMQKMASTERRSFGGTAVTASELKSLAPWLPDAGDSLDVMLTKMDVAGREGEQQFRRVLDIYKNDVNISPFYEAFGIDRFGTFPTGQTPARVATQAPVNPFAQMTDEELLGQ